jgi:pterin-4a-carbinolamine dehydratase
MTEEDKTPLSAAQVDAVLPTLEGWSRSEAVLARTFVFPNFSEITAFLTHLVRTMTEQQHHPDFSLNTGLKMVSVALTTHSEQALTRADLQFARALNAWKRESGA